MVRVVKPVFIASKAMLARKPAHGSPCNGCGLCCVATICALGRHVFKQERGPCPALLKTGDNTYTCGVVVNAPSDELRSAALHLLRAGEGCDARFNGEWTNREFHKRQDEFDEQNISLTERARRLWGMRTP